jgi:hypothetical protein
MKTCMNDCCTVCDKEFNDLKKLLKLEVDET